MSRWLPEGLAAVPGGYRLGPRHAPLRLLLLPGIAGDGRTFLMQRALARQLPALALDLPTGHRTVAGMAAALLAAAPAGPLLIFGLSLGGLVGWAMARQAPDRITGLITLGTLPSPACCPPGLARGQAWLQRLPEPLFARLYRRRIAARLRAEGVAVALRGPLLTCLPRRDVLAERLGAVRAFSAPPPPVPTLWLRGQADTEAPWGSAEVAAHLGVDFAVVPGGHRAHITHPQALHAVVHRFAVSRRMGRRHRP